MAKHFDKELSLDALAKVTDADIDFSDIPELDEAFWSRARVIAPADAKTQLTVRFDADVVGWFKAGGKGYQTRMNAVLRAYVEAMRKAS